MDYINDRITERRSFEGAMDDIKKTRGAEKIYKTITKNNETEQELLLRAIAGQKHKARTNAIIKKAQEVDKLRYPNKKK